MGNQFIDIEFINYIIENKELKVKDMAKSMGLSTQTVQKYLNGADQSHVSADLIFKFANALDIPAIRLLQKEYFIPKKRTKDKD